MKEIITIAIIALFAMASTAQTIDISIEVVAPDSMYIVERTTASPTADNPRPQTTTTYHLKKSWTEVAQMIEAVRRAARAEQDKVTKALENINRMNAAADKIEQAANAQISRASTDKEKPK